MGINRILLAQLIGIRWNKSVATRSQNNQKDQQPSGKQARHESLAQYFGAQDLQFEKDGKQSPNVRKVSELPYQQTQGEMWDEVEQTLCDLLFIEAKCVSGMTYGLIADYNAALDALPEVREQKQKELDLEARIKKYVNDLIAYARGQIAELEVIPSSC